MAISQPRVTIGMPVYNGERYLREALNSILGQTFCEFELIISDNGSTDSTFEICNEYAEKDRRLRLYRNHENIGAAANYNRLVALAQGKYFKWAAADDNLAPEFLEECISILDHHPETILCYPKTIVIDEHGNPVREYPDNLHLQEPTPALRYQAFHERFRTLYECNAIFGLIDTAVLCQTKLIGAFSNSDMVLLSELALRGRFYEVPKHLFFRRDHSATSVRSYPTAYARAAWFDPKKTGKRHAPQWRLFVEFLRTVQCTPLVWRQKVLCYQELGKWFQFNRLGLRKDLTIWLIQAAYDSPQPIFLLLRTGWKLTSMIGYFFRPLAKRQ